MTALVQILYSLTMMRRKMFDFDDDEMIIPPATTIDESEKSINEIEFRDQKSSSICTFDAFSLAAAAF